MKTKSIIIAIVIAIGIAIVIIPSAIKAETHTSSAPHVELHVQSHDHAAAHVGEKFADTHSHFGYFHSVLASHLV